MGFSEKPQLDGASFDSDHNRNWVIAGIPLRAPLKPIYTTVPAVVVVDKPQSPPQDDVVETDEYCCTTPTSEETRIPTIFTCPPAPRKRKPSSSKFNFRRRATPRRFFNPPDLETVFIRAEKAN
ncbi:hypothetical protein K1719_003941 [Acacia pycnantha]|nr:hypothetical protein K1719_003941 [Acacia pycnantha]